MFAPVGPMFTKTKKKNVEISIFKIKKNKTIAAV